MKALQPYYPVFKFVALFALLYIILSLGYYFFLAIEWSAYNYPDPVTAQVSYQTQELLTAIGYNTQSLNTLGQPSVTLFIDEKVIFRVIEGCNAVSVMILFTAFVLAFSKTFYKTLAFLLFGIAFIYLVNLFRLVILGMIYNDYPEYSHFAHEIIFPSIIYGAVILLWIYWIKNKKQAVEN